MNVERVELADFGSWESLELRIAPGVSLISGANGSGKSTILAAVEFALFGATQDAGRLIRRGTDEASVRVELATETGRLSITRSVKRSGTSAKVTLRIARMGEMEWDEITAATVTETQALLDALIGVTRETLRASAFSMQGDGAAFCEAKAADRKRILVETMPSLALWPPLHEAAKAEQRDARAIVAASRVRVEQLDGAGDALEEHRLALVGARLTLGEAEQVESEAEAEATRLAAEAEAAREARRQHAAAVEAAERARIDHERATQERGVADASLQRAKDATANAPSVEDAKHAAGEAALTLARVEANHSAAVVLSQRHREALSRAGRELGDLQAERETGDCARCGQPLHAGVTERLVEATRAFRALEAASAPTPDDEALRAARTAAQAAQTRLAEAETIQSLAGSIEAAEARAADAQEREHQTRQLLGRCNAQVILAQDTVRDVNIEARYAATLEVTFQTREAHRAAAADLARAEAAAQHAEQQAAQEADARRDLADAQQAEVIAGALAAGFGPSGCPAMIVDSVLGDLADESNRVLAELGTPIRLDLRSQRLTKDDRLVDALDIIVLDGTTEAPYETLSGGERTRVALALRAALTRLLANKSGARVRLLVVDEPQGLDASGSEAFADVLQEFVRAAIFESCIVITHDDRLADRIDRVIRIEKTPGGTSRLAESASPGITASDPRPEPTSGVVPAVRTRDESHA